MTTAQILYGVRNGELVHVDEVKSGLACACTCPDCIRPLIAKKGDVLAHHFAHEADDTNCNPTPESLVHAYAKQQVAKLQKLTLPPFSVHATYETEDRAVHELFWRYTPHYCLDVRSAEIEAEVVRIEAMVRPDVLFRTSFGEVAAEVCFRHPVPPDKVEKICNQLHLSTVEIDISDLPVEASSQSINAAISDSRRWKWLHNQHAFYIDADMRRLLARSTRFFFPKPPHAQPQLSMHKVPTRKLATADGLKLRAAQLAQELRELPTHDVLRRVRALGIEMRIALHCHYIGITPTQLPLNLMQTFYGASSLGMHPIVWQTGVFAKFCMAGGEFSVRRVEEWVRAAFEDKALETLESMTQSANGFSVVTEALYYYLRNLSAQGLLQELRGKRPEASIFAPIREKKAAVLALLKQLPAAIAL